MLTKQRLSAASRTHRRSPGVGLSQADPAPDLSIQPSQIPFRHDINGLRALAVLAVIVFHFDLLPARGGFVGVDVFFVISGFLMTTIIRKDVSRGVFGFWRFYSARAMRIIPALAMLCLSLLAFGSVFVDPISYRDMASAVLSTLFFVSNFQYLLTADYFDSVAQDNWLLHTWSLAVEWQFYILYPLVLVPFVKIAALRKWTMPVIWIGLILSLSASVIVTPMGQKYAFYLLPTRVWEFLLGAIITGVSLPSRRWDFGLRWLPYVGLALILISIAVFDSFRSWPSYWALFPTAGAAIVIWSNHAQAWWARNVVVRALGRWSYSLYLWHWPFAVGLRYFFHIPTPWEIAGALAATLVCAVLSYKFIETPGTLKVFQGRWPRGRLLVGLVVCTLALAGLIDGLGGLPQRAGRSHWMDRYLAAAADNAYPDHCGGLTSHGDIRTCDIGNVAAASRSDRILVIGDSFSMQWWSGFETLVSRHPTLAVTFATYNGCPIVPTVARAHPGLRCADYVDKAYRLAASGQYGQIVIGSLWLPYFEPVNGAEGLNTSTVCFREGRRCVLVYDKSTFERDVDRSLDAFQTSVAQLRGDGKRVILMLPQPFSGINIPREMAKTAYQNGGTPQRIWFDAANFDRRERPIRERLLKIGRETGAEVVDPRSLTCVDTRCATSDVTGAPLYVDQLHLRSSFVSQSGFIERVMTKTDGAAPPGLSVNP